MNWTELSAGLPTISLRDITIQRREDGVLQGLHALAVFGAERQHGPLQAAAERLGVDAHPKARGFIGH